MAAYLAGEPTAATHPAHPPPPQTRDRPVQPARLTGHHHHTVANLRTAAGKDPHDEGLHDRVGELSTRSRISLGVSCLQ